MICLKESFKNINLLQKDFIIGHFFKNVLKRIFLKKLFKKNHLKKFI